MHQSMEGLHHIRDIAEKAGIAEDYLHYYGKLSAKVDLELLNDLQERPDGKMILVTAMTPTSYGEGKTVTSIGLAQALERIGKRAMVTLREPSIGPVFGIKGGATGGGRSRVHPHEQINLHFNGDLHAITAAHNLLAAMIDTHVFHGNELRLDPDRIQWPRAMDMNDRALRDIDIKTGKGTQRHTGFVITAASEIMAILALASSRDDLRKRLGDIIIGFNVDGQLVRAADLKVVGALMVLLNEAIMPNLVQTTEGTPGFVHCGPFANIAHGTCSIISQRLALKLADYVVNETGFASDLGAEKYFDIVMPDAGIKPSVAVLIATVKALRAHGTKNGSVSPESGEAIINGFANLRRHIENLRKFGVPIVVSVNRFENDSEEDLRLVQAYCEAAGVECAVSDLFGRGGQGGIDLATKVVAAAAKCRPAKVHPIYERNLSVREKAEAVAREIYGADGVEFDAIAEEKVRAFTESGFGELPICIAKTQASLSDNPKLLGAPSDWTLKISDARLSAGAGFIVLVAGNMMLMPGLPKHPQAVEMDINEHAEVIGLR